MSEDTRDHLHRHHRGASFHDVMVESFSGRFGDAFWTEWEAHVVPHQPERPTYVDLGCGPGLMMRAWRERYPTAALHAVEVQPYMLETAREVAEETGSTIHEADLHALALDLPDGSVDGALCAMVVHEMLEPVGLFTEIARLLAPEGRLMLIDWVRVPLPDYLKRFDDGDMTQASAAERANRLEHFMEHNKYSVEDLTWLMRAAGLEAESVDVYGDGQFVRLVSRRKRGPISVSAR
jgi:ubiquinone/menaquinone biosynthesis C-methylase UbiE